jgi:arginyl-tRNA synthetase
VTTADLLVPPRADRVARLRSGGTITAAELASAVGRDTARFVLLRARPDSMPVLDVDVLSTSTDANPAFRVRHTHARMCAVVRHAGALGVCPGDDPDADTTGLTHRRELDLLAMLVDYDRVSGCNVEYGIARYLESLAEACTRFEVSCPALPVGDNPVAGLHRARVALCADARRVLAAGLHRLDVSAPEQM